MVNQDIDLNLANYDLKDIYKLFNINEDLELTEKMMRSAKSVVLKTHPDKSKLGKEYFLFFSKAYKRLHQYYLFQKKLQTEVGGDANHDYKIPANLQQQNGNKRERDMEKEDVQFFNEWFNKEFEKSKALQEEEEVGYGEWLKSEEGIFKEEELKQVSRENLDLLKNKVKAVTVYKGVEKNYVGFSGALINGNGAYSSDLFHDNSSLSYVDLKQAHMETLIPVTEEDFQRVQKFHSVNEYENFRNQQNMTPMAEKDALWFLKQERIQEGGCHPKPPQQRQQQQDNGGDDDDNGIFAYCDDMALLKRR